MKIKSESLINFLQTKFNKKIEYISEEEKKSLRSISLQGKIDEDYRFGVDFNDLSKFENLRELNISAININNSDIDLINETSIEILNFRRCSFDDCSHIEILQKVKSLKLDNCYLENYEFLKSMNNLESLEILNPYNEQEIDISFVGNKVERLVLERCNIDNLNSIADKKNLEYLSFLWTILPKDCSKYLNCLPNLKQIFISAEYAQGIAKRDELKVNTDYCEYAFDDVNDTASETRFKKNL